MNFLENQLVREILLLVFVGALSTIVYQVVRRHVLGLLHKFFLRTKFKWDQILIEEGVLPSAALLIPAFIVSQTLPFLELTHEFIVLMLRMWSLVVVTITLDRVLNLIVTVYNTFPVAQRVPIKGMCRLYRLLCLSSLPYWDSLSWWGNHPGLSWAA